MRAKGETSGKVDVESGGCCMPGGAGFAMVAHSPQQISVLQIGGMQVYGKVIDAAGRKPEQGRSLAIETCPGRSQSRSTQRNDCVSRLIQTVFDTEGQ